MRGTGNCFHVVLGGHQHTGADNLEKSAVELREFFHTGGPWPFTAIRRYDVQRIERLSKWLVPVADESADVRF